METEALEEMLETVRRAQRELERIALFPLGLIEEGLLRELLQRKAAKLDAENVEFIQVPGNGTVGLVGGYVPKERDL